MDGTVTWRPVGAAGRVAAWVAAAGAAVAPVVVLVGAGLAAAAQPSRYDPVRQTFSALAKQGATDRWIMSGTLLALGLVYVIVGATLPGLRRRGRFVLATGGLAVALAALLPQPAHGDSAGHLVAAGAGWAAFTLWPLAASRPGSDRARDRWSARSPALVATAVLVALLSWFVVELLTGGDRLGLAQRIVVVAQTVWPVVVAVGRLRGARHDAGGPDDVPRRP